MPRPSMLSITPQQQDWDAQVDTNFQVLTAGPIPLALFYKTTPSAGAVDIATLDAADYEGCYGHLRDPANIVTDGQLIYSDGADWLYVRSGNTV